MMEPRRVAILGSTGSIGRQALDVVRAHRERFSVVALAAHRNDALLRRQADEFSVAYAGLGTRAAVEAATRDDVDVVLNAVVGATGLAASLAALGSGKLLALANKESLVAAGDLCMRSARQGSAAIVPVDSEHAALAQCLEGRDRATITSVVITASGGPFRTRADLDGITPADALAHPTWRMGRKITIDCATLFNKGLEVIEAHHLFGIDYDDIDVVVHPQSVVHAVVRLRDGSVVMQAAAPDMRLPIRAALSYPERLGPEVAPLDLAEVGTLTFHELDHERFPAVSLAYRAGRAGRSLPAALNAANEEAVQAFLEGRLEFRDIAPVVADVLGDHDPIDIDGLAAVEEVDRWARRRAATVIARAGTTAPAGRG